MRHCSPNLQCGGQCCDPSSQVCVQAAQFSNQVMCTDTQNAIAIEQTFLGQDDLGDAGPYGQPLDESLRYEQRYDAGQDDVGQDDLGDAGSYGEPLDKSLQYDQPMDQSEAYYSSASFLQKKRLKKKK